MTYQTSAADFVAFAPEELSRRYQRVDPMQEQSADVQECGQRY